MYLRFLVQAVLRANFPVHVHSRRLCHYRLETIHRVTVGSIAFTRAFRRAITALVYEKPEVLDRHTEARRLEKGPRLET